MALEDYPPELVKLVREELQEGLDDYFLHGDNRGEEVLDVKPLICGVVTSSGWGSQYACTFNKDHKGPHSWVVDI